MKQAIAILLLILLVFNWYGYRIIAPLASEHASASLSHQLDNHIYDESSLIEVRLPLSIPYYKDQPTFERHYGEVEVNGKHYSYVKSKIENGFLILKCISNSKKDKIQKAGTDTYQQSEDPASNPSDKKSGVTTSKNYVGDYDDRLIGYATTAFANLQIKNYGAPNCRPQSIFSPVAGHPPQHTHSSHS